MKSIPARERGCRRLPGLQSELSLFSWAGASRPFEARSRVSSTKNIPLFGFTTQSRKFSYSRHLLIPEL